MVRIFAENFDDPEKRIAVIGTAFQIRNDFAEYNKTVHKTFTSFLDSYLPPATSQLLPLLKSALHQLPSPYAGVHIRFSDGAAFDCNQTDVRALYASVLSELREKNVSNGTHIFIGRSHKNVQKCFNEHAKGFYPGAITINDIVDGNPELQKLMKQVSLEPSHIFSFLDQSMIALGETVVMTRSMFGGSTFQRFIHRRHAMRQYLMRQLQND